MASSTKKINQGILFRAESTHFFQFILGENKLMLPRKFVRNYGHNLSSHVMLKMPIGRLQWKVKVVKSVNGSVVWLQNGWPEFVEFYNIVHGSFLVFDYDKNNGDFNVSIFDKTTTEIDYLNEPNIVDEAKGPRFVKMICGDTIGEKKMSIPKKFVRDYGHKLSNRVNLKLPNGEKWKIDILKANGKIWLENKWHEFMEFYSVAIGCPVVFQYDESISGFNVNIYDHTYMEIDYPYSHTIFNEATTQPELVPKPEQETTFEHVHVQISAPNSPSSVEILDHFPTQSRKTNTKSTMPSSLPSKPETMNRGCQVDTAKKATSTNQYCQVQILSDCLRRHRMYLPRDFVDHIEEGTEAATLEVNSKRWTVKLHIYDYRDRKTAVLRGGWGEFARDNSLKVGDVCNFVLIDNSHQTLLMKVSIMREMFITP